MRLFLSAVVSLPALLCGLSAPAMAQEVPPCDETCLAGQQVVLARPLWTATLGAGYTSRGGGSEGDFEMVSLTRQLGRGYVRLGATRFRSTTRQADAALPSTYLVGTLGVGANFDNWVIDADASYGRQSYGPVELAGITRQSNAASGSPYYAATVSLGKIHTIAPGWYATPTMALGYAHGELLRPASFGRRALDFETGESAWTLSSSLRIDHAVGRSADGAGNEDGVGRHFLGLMLTQRWTNNAVSELVPVPPTDPAGPPFLAVRYADSWQEAILIGNFRLSRRLWLDSTIARSFGARAGDTLTATTGLRLHF